MEKWLFLLLGGALGTGMRYVLTGVVYHRVGNAFPWGTLVVNLAGCFLIGFLDVVFERKLIPVHHYRIFLMTGFCGAFTTLSTVMLETSDITKQSHFIVGLGNILITAGFGFILFKLGALLAEAI